MLDCNAIWSFCSEEKQIVKSSTLKLALKIWTESSLLKVFLWWTALLQGRCKNVCTPWSMMSEDSLIRCIVWNDIQMTTHTPYTYVYIYIIHVLYLFHLVLIFYNFLKHFSDKIQIDCPEWLSYSVSSPQFQQMEIKGEYKSLRQDEIPVWGRHFKKVWMLRVQILEGFDDDIRNWPSSWLADNSFTIWGRVPCERLRQSFLHLAMFPSDAPNSKQFALHVNPCSCMFAWSVPFLQATFDVIRHWFDAVLLENQIHQSSWRAAGLGERWRNAVLLSACSS